MRKRQAKESDPTHQRIKGTHDILFIKHVLDEKNVEFRISYLNVLCIAIHISITKYLRQVIHIFPRVYQFALAMQSDMQIH